ncbi:MAG TPA: hypothetical protein DEP46_19460 [Blastocatellia bacterium]|nr:hypothetical protein [Blastocatellia bacterium]
MWNKNYVKGDASQAMRKGNLVTRNALQAIGNDNLVSGNAFQANRTPSYMRGKSSLMTWIVVQAAWQACRATRFRYLGAKK